MNRRYVQHALIAAGVLAIGFLFWYLFFPGSDAPLTVDELRLLLIEGGTEEQRAMGAAGLGQRGDKASMPLLLAAMNDESTLVRARAGVAVRKILGTDFFFDPQSPPDQRQEAIEKYTLLWEAWKAKTGYQGEKESGK